MRHETITDPGFNMVAYDVNVPANWKFNGMYSPGNSCSNVPFPVFRAYSPDGLTELRRLPRLDWAWSNSRFAPKQQQDCLALDREMPAQDFLKYLAGILQVNYVRDAPVPQAAIDNQKRNLEQLNTISANNAKMMNRPPIVQKGELAAAFAEYRNGSFTIEEHLSVNLSCIHVPLPSPQEPNAFREVCNATVRMVRAPKGQLAGVLAMLDSQAFGARENAAWVQKYLQVSAQQNAAMLNQMAQQSQALMQQRQNEFNRAQAVRAQQHQQFLQTMQQGTDRALANARAVANSNHAIAQDWCDYALDRQTVTGPGGTVKVSNAYGQTWTDGKGQYYQTNDPNANPNGVLAGTWTMTTQVHGDGTAK